MRTILTGFLLIAAAAGVGAVVFSAFIVDQTHKALVLQFGEPVKQIDEPGLYWRTPFVQSVEQFDRRILDLETDEQEVIASDQKRLVVDAFARYRILDPLQFYRAFRTEAGARPRLTAILDSTIRNVLGRAAFIDVVRNKREALMKQKQHDAFLVSTYTSVKDIEALRDAWYDAPDLATQQKLGREMQLVALEEVPYVPVGLWRQPIARRDNITGSRRRKPAAFRRAPASAADAARAPP